MAKIAVIGAGHVELTTAAGMAALGHDIVCADIDPAKVAKLKAGIIPIRELGMDELVREGLHSGRLKFVLGAANASNHRASFISFAYLLHLATTVLPISASS